MAKAFAMALMMVAISACVPGGLIMPVPVSHVDVPALRGVVVVENRPAADVSVQMSTDDTNLPLDCTAPEAETQTNHLGEFEFVVDRSRWTLFWTDEIKWIAICVPSVKQGVIWSRKLASTHMPPFYPPSIDLTCIVDGIDSDVCVTSLDDENMPDCGDDLDYQHPTGWVEVTNSKPFTGRCVSHHDNGEILERADFVDGIRIGLWVGFDEEGARDHQSYWIDSRRLRSTEWHQNGQILRQIHYRKTTDERGFPVRHGLNTAWYENGSIEYQTCWKDGRQVHIDSNQCIFY